MKTFNESAEAKAKHLVKTLLMKQRDYGTGNILNSPVDPILGIAVRLNDKVARLVNLIQTGNPPENESVEDTMLDIAGYAFVAMMVSDGTFELPLDESETVTEEKHKEALENVTEAFKKHFFPTHNKILSRADTDLEKELMITRLLEIWKENPELRLGQLI